MLFSFTCIGSICILLFYPSQSVCEDNHCFRTCIYGRKQKIYLYYYIEFLIRETLRIIILLINY